MKINFALPKGSLEKDTFLLLKRAGYRITNTERSYKPKLNDPDLNVKMLRPQEIPKFVEAGNYDIGISGIDWVVETQADVVELLDLNYGKVSLVVAVSNESEIKTKEDLKELGRVRVATEYMSISKRYFEELGIKADIMFSWGATEAKPPEEADVIIDNSATGKTIKENDLRIIDTLMTSTARLIANKNSMIGEKFEKINSVKIMLDGAVRGESKVIIEMNVPEEKVDTVASLLPALEKPTISKLYGENWFSLKTVVNELDVIKLIPKLKKAGAKDIVEYEIRKIIP